MLSLSLSLSLFVDATTQVYGPVVMNSVPVLYRALKYRVLLDNNNKTAMRS